MPTVYFIEYEETIVFFQEDIRYEVTKNQPNLKELKKLENKFNFVNLLEHLEGE